MRRDDRHTSMYSSTTLMFASSCAVRLAGKLTMAFRTPKRFAVSSALSLIGMILEVQSRAAQVVAGKSDVEVEVEIANLIL